MDLLLIQKEVTLWNKYIDNKKVLLHECKRHTACHVASADYARGGTPSQVRGGTLSQVRGYPIPGWWYPIPGPGGTPSQGPGVPHPRSGGVPCPRSGGYPIPGLGVPCPDLVMGGYPILTWSVGTLGTPPSRPGMGYPPIQTWDGVPPHPDLGWGTPPA